MFTSLLHCSCCICEDVDSLSAFVVAPFVNLCKPDQPGFLLLTINSTTHSTRTSNDQLFIARTSYFSILLPLHFSLPISLVVSFSGQTIIQQDCVIRGDLANVKIGRHCVISAKAVIRPPFKKFTKG